MCVGSTVALSVAETELILTAALRFHLAVASFRLYLNTAFVVTAAILDYLGENHEKLSLDKWCVICCQRVKIHDLSVIKPRCSGYPLFCGIWFTLPKAMAMLCSVAFCNHCFNLIIISNLQKVLKWRNKQRKEKNLR